ncbi:MAG: cytochrome c oxidase assembly protein [Gammaproteobacteria bacterium]|nr:MAG: cytochrome c oxidase assembly protein [Gammaproteobacteria bacterium]
MGTVNTPETDRNGKTPGANRRTVVTLLLIVVGMFGFGFVLVPIYSVFCKVTGINGKTGTLATAEARRLEVDESRWVTVEFVAAVNNGINWEFRPEQVRMKVHPGKMYRAWYRVRNNTGQPVVGQAIPSVMPGVASKYFKKTECFCFTNQPIGAHEEKRMPLVFVIEPDLPEDVHTVSLGYTFFDITRTAGKAAANNRGG